VNPNNGRGLSWHGWKPWLTLLALEHSTPDGEQRGYSARDREGNLWTFGVKRFGVSENTR
jgi:hypothetical protein